MFQGFILNIDQSFFKEDAKYSQDCNFLNINKKIIQEELEKYVVNDEIDVKQLEETWFPEIKAEVFISHSHKDEKLAICLADWLYDNFGITSFIDSCLWGCANDLLRQIDNQMCMRKKANDGKITYNYNKRNVSTAHVHIILSMALQKMIDKTECLFFLNTPNSVKLEDNSSGMLTSSCWIYNEILFSKLVKRRKPERYKLRTANILESVERFSYELETDHLINISEIELKKWKIESDKKTYLNSNKYLDILYKVLGIIESKE